MAPQAAPVSANDRGDEPDRFHNQHDPAGGPLAQSVDELEAAIRSLEERVASMNVDLSYQIDTVERHGDRATRQLALEVAEMGEALSRRIRDQPESAAPRIVKASPRRLPRRLPRWAPPVAPLTLGLSGALVAALSALAWSLLHHPAAVIPPKPPAPSAPALYAPTPPAPAAVATDSKAAASPP